MPRETWLKKKGNELLDLVYPPGLYCACCGKIIDSSRTYSLCNDCMKAISWVNERHCEKCGRPLADNDPGSRCFGCAQREASGQRYSFDKGYACASYGAVAQSVIFAFKYGGQADIGNILGEVLYDRMAAEYDPDELSGMYDMVLPVPAFREKKLRRGFDHAALMGESFAKRAGLSFDGGAVIRNRATVPMKGLGPEERAANIKGAFEIRNSRLPMIEDSRILLIDDIFTTGSTIDEIAGVLKEPRTDRDGKERRGAARVDFLAFAAAGDMVAGDMVAGDTTDA